MKKKSLFLAVIALVILIPAVFFIVIRGIKIPNRPEGPCDVYSAGGTPCVAAHSSTRALYATYNGPLYQIMRQSDGKTLDIGVVKPSNGDPGGYADAAAQDKFCANTYCWVTILYDQSGNGNHLRQAPRGGFSGLAMGGFNNVPIADWAPITLMGHKVYGLHIAPGMGLRWNDAKGTAVDDQAEGQYWVISGDHYNSGCCYDYGNAETDSRDDGDGTMETTYFGNQGAWYHGAAPGPWIMTDQENNLVGCVNEDPNDKYCADLPTINWRFVTATADGEPHHWRSMGGDAQKGDLQIMYDGKRIQNPRNSYDPMRKQGAILLGNGGDNSNGSAGTFYEAAMTAPNTFPTIDINQAVQANIVAAGYDVQTLALGRQDMANLFTFAPKGKQIVPVIFQNTTDKAIEGLKLTVNVPSGWTVESTESNNSIETINYTVQPGQKVMVNFKITSSDKQFNGDIKAIARWNDGKQREVTAISKVRNVQPIKINEFAVSDGKGNSTNQFIELYNAGEKSVDISGWSLTQHAVHMPYFSSIVVPMGTKIEAGGFYLFGLSNSGLAVQATKGDKTIYVRDTKGMKVGNEITIGTGKNQETCTIASIIVPTVETETQGNSPFGRRSNNVVGTSTTIWQPLPDGPVITIPKGSKNIPVTNTAGFKVGQKMAIGYGSTYPAVSNSLEKYEVVTITEVGKPGTQAYLSMDAKPGDTNIKVSSVQNITVGDKIRLDIASEGHGIETVTVKSVGTQSSRNTLNGPLGPNDDPGTGLELEQPLKYAHSSNMPFSVNGTGISFEPATKYAHSSNEPVLPLVFAIELQNVLANAHDIDDVVFDATVTDAGYQGETTANQLFGGPALSTQQGAMVLRNANGLVVDALNYGGVVDPWLSEGFQGLNRADGNFVQTPTSGGRGFGFRAPVLAISPDLSAGRYPDGTDSDDNRADFHIQQSQNITADAASGDNNIKVSSVLGIKVGQTIILGNGENRENITIMSVGTPGSTTISSNASAGTKRILVSSSQNFTPGQEIVLSNGKKHENAQIASIASARRGFFFGMDRANLAPSDTIILTTAIRNSFVSGSSLSGTGVTLSKPLASNHSNGDILINSVPSPGKSNQY